MGALKTVLVVALVTMFALYAWMVVRIDLTPPKPHTSAGPTARGSRGVRGGLITPQVPAVEPVPPDSASTRTAQPGLEAAPLPRTPPTPPPPVAPIPARAGVWDTPAPVLSIPSPAAVASAPVPALVPPPAPPATAPAAAAAPVNTDPPPPAPAVVQTPATKHYSGKALIFTMDSLKNYIENAKRGGPAGEITVRKCLMEGLADIGITSDVAGSDAEFFRLARNIEDYSLIFLDPWTFVDPGYTPRKFLIGRESRVFLLDFFGSKQAGHGLKIKPTQILTPYPTPWNSMLGFFIDPAKLPPPRTKRNIGVIWGKDPKYLRPQAKVLKAIADSGVELHSSCSSPVVRHRNIKYRGTLPKAEWHKLLGEAKFLLGLGDPLLGPSAIEAVSSGVMFINPSYKKPKAKIYMSQHPFLAEQVGEEYVCSTDLDDISSVRRCVDKALAQSLPPIVPTPYSKAAYAERVREIFEPVLDRTMGG